MEYLARVTKRHSILIFAASTTLAHFSVSPAISLPNSACGPGSGVPPWSASTAATRSGKARIISLFSLSTMSAGVLFGAPTPYHWLKLVTWDEIAEGRNVG